MRPKYLSRRILWTIDVLLLETPSDSQLFYCASFHIHWMWLCLKQSDFSEDQILGEFVSSPDACYCFCSSVYVTFSCISCYFLARQPAFIFPSMLFCSSAPAFLLLSFLTFVLFSFVAVVCHLQIEFNLEQIHGECIENFSVLMWFSLHGVKDNKLLFVCLIAPHLPPSFDVHSVININGLQEA